MVAAIGKDGKNMGSSNESPDRIDKIVDILRLIKDMDMSERQLFTDYAIQLSAAHTQVVDQAHYC